MAAPKGHARYGGRTKGTLNKSTAATKQALQEAFERIGSVPALAEWAQENRTEFYKIWVRLLPTEVTGADGGDIKMHYTIAWQK